MRVAFRADASVEMGLGHVMRCLTLADALAPQGGTSVFLSADQPGHVHQIIQARGHDLITLPRAGLPQPGADIYETWLGTTPAADAAQTGAILQDLQADWVVLDHYALGADWVHQAVPADTQVMVIDDLANRMHHCDLLLDQNLGRTDADYHGLVPQTARVMTGPKYALLRPEFAAARPKSLARRKTPNLRHIMVSLGGADKDNVTATVLELLRKELEGQDIKVTVVMGQSAPHLEQVRALAKTLTPEATVLCNVQNMADLMVQADLAIGAAGSTSWERCCLGLPTLLLVLAENQRPAARAMKKAQAALFGNPLETDGDKAAFCTALRTVTDSKALTLYSQNAADLTNGFGADICVDHMTRGSSVES